jgi:hypothetical protein
VRDRPNRAHEFLESQRLRLTPPYSPFHLWVAVRSVHTSLYMGDGEAALAALERELPIFEKSPLSRGRFFRSMNDFLLARASLMAATKRPAADAAKLIAHAASIGKRLSRAGQPHARALSLLIQAEVAQRSGDTPRALRKLRECVEGASDHEAPMMSTYARRALGVLLGGATGAALIEEADAALRKEGVESPARWTQIWIGMRDYCAP